MSTPKDVTVSKLSQLQKRVLVYARQQMLAKGQTIDAPTTVTLCMRAPEWLDKALCEAMAAITKARKGYVLVPLGADDSLKDVTYLAALHPWLRPFAEMTFLLEHLRAAAKAAGVNDTINLMQLYKLASPGEAKLAQIQKAAEQARSQRQDQLDGAVQTGRSRWREARAVWIEEDNF